MHRANSILAATRPRLAKAVLIASLAVSVGGCEDYLDRRDTLSRVAGEANAFNKATHTIDRWPKHANRDRWRSDGERARTAVERYRTGNVTPPPAVGSSANVATAPPGAPAAAGSATTTSK